MLSKLAQSHEMGESLIQRLFTYYRIMPERCVQNHSASLLTNYRCHSSILSLTSSLFYEHTLLSRSQSQTHPLAPYPLVFTCCSIDNRNLRSLPVEDRTEARVLVEKMRTFVMKCPRKKHNEKYRVGLLASSRIQVSKPYTNLKFIHFFSLFM